MSITVKSRYTRRANLLDRKLHDGFVIYDAKAQALHVLNPSAEFIWRHCDGRHTAAEIIAQATISAERPVGEVAEHVYTNLKVLVAKGLVDAV